MPSPPGGPRVNGLDRPDDLSDCRGCDSGWSSKYLRLNDFLSIYPQRLTPYCKLFDFILKDSIQSLCKPLRLQGKPLSWKLLHEPVEGAAHWLQRIAR
jgi:hypothetical protein